MGWFKQLMERNVIRVAIAYLVASWLIVRTLSTLLPIFEVEVQYLQVLIIVLAIGLLPVCVLAWMYELTPDGLKRENEASEERTPRSHRRLDRLIILGLSLAVAYFLLDELVLSRTYQTENPTSASADSSPLTMQPTPSDVRGPAPYSIAVLPFVNMSADAEQEYFADGLSEELLNLLAALEELEVTSRTSAFSFKDSQLSIVEIANKLNVAFVLEGSVRKGGGLIRITAQLIDARTDVHVWTETWDRSMEDVFAVQDEIATTVANRMLGSLRDANLRSKKVNADAYEAFLEAKQLLRRYDETSLERAERLLLFAINLEPEFAKAWTLLGHTYGDFASSGSRDYAAYTKKAQTAYERAIQIDPRSNRAQADLAILFAYQGELTKAAEHINQALASDSKDPSVLNATSTFLYLLNRLEPAILISEKLVGLDPLNPSAHFNLAASYEAAGKLAEAETAYRDALELEPGQAAVHAYLALVIARQGRLEEALEILEKEPADYYRTAILPLVLAYGGDSVEATKVMNVMMESDAHGMEYAIASVFAVLGDTDSAFAWLQKSRTGSDTSLININVDPAFSALHQDKRWSMFLASIDQDQTMLDTIAINLPKHTSR